MNDTLASCPFCGGTNCDYEPSRAWWRGYCPDCGAHGAESIDKAEAAAAWNRRVPGAGVPAEVVEAINWLDEYSQPLVAKPDEWTQRWNIVRNWLDAQAQEGDA